MLHLGISTYKCIIFDNDNSWLAAGITLATVKTHRLEALNENCMKIPQILCFVYHHTMIY